MVFTDVLSPTTTPVRFTPKRSCLEAFGTPRDTISGASCKKRCPDLLSPSLSRSARERSFLDVSKAPGENTAAEIGCKKQQPDTSILSWLNNISADPLSRSGPVVAASSNINSSECIPKQTLPSTEIPFDNSQHNNDKDTASQTTTSKSNVTTIKPSSSKYRNVLEYNGIEIDATGLKMAPEIRNLVNKDILKRRSSPPLPEEVLNSTVKSMNLWGSSTEHVVNNFMSSTMFPVTKTNLGHGGNSQWPRDALPYDPDYGYGISTPKPDYHIGYAVGKKSGFTAREAHVLDHPRAQKLTQPGTGNCLPFLTVELKSEATGGTLFHAENQAAGSGTYMVCAMEWLLQEAKVRATDLDSVAWSIAATGRLVVVSIHWFSSTDRIYYMSYVKSFVTTDTEHVQACHSTIKNILDWAIDNRQAKLKSALQALYPISLQWSKRKARPGEDEEEIVNGGGGNNNTASESQRSQKNKPSSSRSRTSSVTTRDSSQARKSLLTLDSSISRKSGIHKDPTAI